MVKDASQTPSETIDPHALLTVLDAYRKGDFSQWLPSDWTGLSGKVADTLNGIIDQSSDMVGEFGRVAQVVGKQGKIGERIELPGLKGAWGNLIESSNALANDLVSPMNEVVRVVAAIADGNLSQTVPLEVEGLRLQGQFQKSADIVNTMVSRLSTFASEVTRVAREVGTEGKLGGQAEVQASWQWRMYWRPWPPIAPFAPRSVSKRAWTRSSASAVSTSTLWR